MVKLLRWYEDAKEQLHPVDIAALFHLNLSSYILFIDGNRRTARLLMNLILMQHGYPPAVIKVVDRLRYIEALEKASMTGETDDFDDVVADAVESGLQKYLKVIDAK